MLWSLASAQLQPLARRDPGAMGNTMRKQPQPVDIDDLFEQMERERKGEAAAQPAASGGGGFLAACFEEQATPDFDVDTIHLRYPITDDERVRHAPLLRPLRPARSLSRLFCPNSAR